MNLEDTITFLEKLPRDLAVEKGFTHVHSYRGDYACLAFEPCDDTTVGAMLDCAKSAMGQTFHGYRGGKYTMSGLTDCYLCEYGTSNDSLEISEYLLGAMIAGPSVAKRDLRALERHEVGGRTVVLWSDVQRLLDR